MTHGRTHSGCRSVPASKRFAASQGKALSAIRPGACPGPSRTRGSPRRRRRTPCCCMTAMVARPQLRLDTPSPASRPRPRGGGWARQSGRARCRSGRPGRRTRPAPARPGLAGGGAGGRGSRWYGRRGRGPPRRAPVAPAPGRRPRPAALPAGRPEGDQPREQERHEAAPTTMRIPSPLSSTG
jgi:hypothetical protein